MTSPLRRLACAGAAFAAIAVPAAGAHAAPAATPAAAQRFAPVDRPGPALDVPADLLAASLHCSATVVPGSEAVLLVPATTATPREDYGWNYMPAFDTQRRPYCTVTLPDHGMGDIQAAAEYVVSAIRSIHARTGERVQVIGHSQGGVEPRWALRFWPDIRAMVDDDIAFAPPNHGSVLVPALCVPDCAPALWQQRWGSALTEALNSEAEIFPGISYTVVYTHLDDVVQPNLDDQGSSSLRGASAAVRNIAVQDICPNDVADHVALGTYDPVAYALALDALDHPGPADPSRIDRSVCSRPFMPGVDPLSFPTDYADAYGVLATQLATYPHSRSEPPLRCYVTGRCSGEGTR
jgi:hypothetical protein